MREKVEFANALRGIAALSVVVSHYFAAFWVIHPHLPHFIGTPALVGHYDPPRIANFILSLSALELGPYGVALFFLISGFVIPFAITKYSTAGFIVARAFRILPTYAAGFAVTVGALMIGTAWYGTQLPATWNQIAIHSIAGLRLAMSSKPIDLILWTLEVELAFYVVCCLAAPLLRRASMWTFAIPVTIAIVDAMFGQQIKASKISLATDLLVDLHYVIFLFVGVAFHFAHTGAMQTKRAIFGAAITMVAYTYSSLFGIERYIHLMMSYGPALATFIGAWAFADHLPNWRPVRFFADISFPLYACHPILGYVALRILADYRLASSTAAVVLTVLACGIAYIIHRAVENPTHRIGQRLAQRLQGTAAIFPEVVPAVPPLTSPARSAAPLACAPRVEHSA
jgi:peptidoglycan/LPS O-acetylase OafA/YrhL